MTSFTHWQSVNRHSHRHSTQLALLSQAVHTLPSYGTRVGVGGGVGVLGGGGGRVEGGNGGGLIHLNDKDLTAAMTKHLTKPGPTSRVYKLRRLILGFTTCGGQRWRSSKQRSNTYSYSCGYTIVGPSLSDLTGPWCWSSGHYIIIRKPRASDHECTACEAVWPSELIG